MYEPGRRVRHQYENDRQQVSDVRDFYEETYWDDLNRWLEAREPRLTYRFPAPAEAHTAQVGATASQETTASAPTWQVDARRRADEIAAKRWNAGIRNNSAREIAKCISRDWQDDATHHGSRGALDANTIRTHALRGWKFRPPGSSGPNGS
jgi:hypothetical protein